MMRRESPASSPREISSRSASDRRRGDRGLVLDLMPPVFARSRCTDFEEHPTAAAAPTYVSPARTRR